MAIHISELREIARERGLVVWIANGTGKRGHPSYIGDVTLARLRPGAFRRARACENARRDEIADAKYFTAWNGRISATRQVRLALAELQVSRYEAVNLYRKANPRARRSGPTAIIHSGSRRTVFGCVCGSEHTTATSYRDAQHRWQWEAEHADCLRKWASPVE